MDKFINQNNEENLFNNSSYQMTLQFDQLPAIIIEEIFKYINPDELFDLRFLNKSFLKNINHVIKYNLVYSVYSDSSHENNKEYQQKFIKENGVLMRHLNVNTYTYDQITYCPNITSLKYYDLILSIINMSNNNRLNNSMSKLKKVKLTSYNYITMLSLLSTCLKDVESFELNGHNLNIKDIINYLNPNKLNSFKLSAVSVNLDGLEIIKTKFKKLKKLSLELRRIISTPTKLNLDINFSSKLELQLTGNITSNIIQHFGDLKKLESIKLKNNVINYFEFNDDILRLLEGSNNLTLGRIYSDFQFNDVINRSFTKLSTLKEIYIEELPVELLSSIFLLPSVQRIQCETVSNNLERICRLNYFHSSSCDVEQCKFIKQIEICTYISKFEQFIYFLSMFPNLEVIKIKCFTLIDSNEQFEYTLTTRLLIITPIDNEILREEVEKNPMINWYKLEKDNV